jgi:two-component system OmpR family response regulator
VVRFALEKAGHKVIEAADGKKALELFQAHAPEVVVLDIVMPELDGIEVCRQLRQSSRVPIVFLSSRDDELDRVLGLEIGADDYVTKPFSPRELVARVKALLRRLTPEPTASTELLKQGSLAIDPVRHQVTWEGREVILTVTEFGVLQSLMGMPGKVYSRNEVVDRAYGHGHYITDRTVDTHVRRIRKKFEPLSVDPIETVYGVGYRLKA